MNEYFVFNGIKFVPDSSVIIPPVPGIRRYFVKRDWETREFQGAVRKRAIELGGAPCVFRTGKWVDNSFFQSAKLTKACLDAAFSLKTQELDEAVRAEDDNQPSLLD